MLCTTTEFSPTLTPHLDGLLHALCQEGSHADKTILPAVVGLVAEPEGLVRDAVHVHVGERELQVTPEVDGAVGPGAVRFQGPYGSYSSYGS